MYTLARLFSNILSPILMPSYAVFIALWTSILFYLSPGTRWVVVGVTFIITCIIPAAVIFILHKIGRISDIGLNNQSERSLPYIVTTLCYIAAATYMVRVNAPMWLTMFLIGGAVAAIISLLINKWWKISAHMAAAGGVMALAFRIASNHINVVPMDSVIYTSIILAGILGTSRLILERHTLGQVLAGTAIGFTSVYLLTMIN